jgi:signal transduction histidine kinase
MIRSVSANVASAKRMQAASRDALLVIVATATAAIVSTHYELSEALLEWTRTREHYQLDEVPGILLVLALGLAWFAARRYREARDELRKRADAERALARALEDRQALAQQHARVWDSERKRLARELHDELGQYVNAIKIDAVEIRENARRHELALERPATAIIDAANHVHRAVSDMIRRLRPVGLDDLGLTAALEHCVGGWRERLRGTTFDLRIDGDTDDFGDARNLALYRIAQEGLTNISKHAQATRVDIRLARHQAENGRDEIVFSLFDDGVGGNGKGAGFGLIGMRERVESLGGSLMIDTKPGGGFRIVARLPIKYVEEDAREQPSQCLAG